MRFILLMCLFYLFCRISGQKTLQYSLVDKFYVQSQPLTTIYSCSRSKTCCAVACTGHSLCEFFSFSRDEDVCKLYGRSCTSDVTTVYNSSWSTYKKANSSEFASACVSDQSTNGSDWTVFQRRQDGSVCFQRNYSEYVKGFGNPCGEFWLGLENMYQLLSNGSYELRIDLQDFDNSTAFTTYSNFSLGNAASGYMLHLGGFTGGNLCGHFLLNNGMVFTAQDNMTYATQSFKGAWWYHSFPSTNCYYYCYNYYYYNSYYYYYSTYYYYYKYNNYTCYTSNLNGLYRVGYYTSEYPDGITWTSFYSYWYSLKFTEMKFRRTS